MFVGSDTSVIDLYEESRSVAVSPLRYLQRSRACLFLRSPRHCLPMEIIPIKMALANFYVWPKQPLDLASSRSTGSNDASMNGNSETASYRSPLLSLRCFAGGQIYLDVPPSGGAGPGAPPTAPPPHI